MLTLADGQLATSATAIVTGTGVAVDVVLSNTSASLTQTIVITMTRSGGTARRLRRVVLAPNEQVSINGVPLEAGDTLLGATTTATTVDYVVIRSGQPFGMVALDANGAVKQVDSGLVGTLSLTGALTAAGVTTAGIVNSTVTTLAPGASTAAAGTDESDAGALPAATATVYPTTAADDATGVIIHADDQVTGRLLFIGNGVSNKILKVYPPAGGSINGAAADAAFSSVSGKGVIITCLDEDDNTWLAW